MIGEGLSEEVTFVLLPGKVATSREGHSNQRSGDSEENGVFEGGEAQVAAVSERDREKDELLEKVPRAWSHVGGVRSLACLGKPVKSPERGMAPPILTDVRKTRLLLGGQRKGGEQEVI